MRWMRMRSTPQAAPASASGTASNTKPGLIPAAAITVPAFAARRSRRAASPGLSTSGQASSSLVHTTRTPRRAHRSMSGRTSPRGERVAMSAASGAACSNISSGSSQTSTPAQAGAKGRTAPPSAAGRRTAPATSIQGRRRHRSSAAEATLPTPKRTTLTLAAGLGLLSDGSIMPSGYRARAIRGPSRPIPGATGPPPPRGVEGSAIHDAGPSSGRRSGRRGPTP